MRKQDIIAREKKQSILDFIEKNNINVSHREFARITQRHKLENLIYSIEKIKIGDLYYSGLIDISSDSHSFCKLSNSYYECEECKNIYKLFFKINNEKHIESRLKINDLLDNTSLNELRDLLLKSDRVKIYEEITGDNWKSLRQEAVKIYNYECPRCHKNIKENPFNLHHSIPFSFKQENSDLIVLCHSCHMKVEAKFNKKFSETRDIYLSRDYSLEDIDDLFYYRDSKNAQRQ